MTRDEIYGRVARARKAPGGMLRYIVFVKQGLYKGWALGYLICA